MQTTRNGQRGTAFHVSVALSLLEVEREDLVLVRVQHGSSSSGVGWFVITAAAPTLDR